MCLDLFGTNCWRKHNLLCFAEGGTNGGRGTDFGSHCNVSSSCRWVRGEHFRYKFSQPGGQHAQQQKWWIRKRLGPYFPPVDLKGLKKFFKARNWPDPKQNWANPIGDPELPPVLSLALLWVVWILFSVVDTSQQDNPQHSLKPTRPGIKTLEFSFLHLGELRPKWMLRTLLGKLCPWISFSISYPPD